MKKHSLIFFRFLKQYLVGAQVPQSFKKCAKTAYFRTPTKILIFYDRELIFVLLDSSHQDDQFDTLKLHFILKNNKDTWFLKMPFFYAFRAWAPKVTFFSFGQNGSTFFFVNAVSYQKKIMKNNGKNFAL